MHNSKCDVKLLSDTSPPPLYCTCSCTVTHCAWTLVLWGVMSGWQDWAWPLYITDICGFRCRILFLCVCVWVGGGGGAARVDKKLELTLQFDVCVGTDCQFHIHAACGGRTSWKFFHIEIKTTGSHQVTPSSINTTKQHTIWPVSGGCGRAVCVCVCVCVCVPLMCESASYSVAAAQEYPVNRNSWIWYATRPLATEGNWFVCSVCSVGFFLCPLTHTDVIRGILNK